MKSKYILAFLKANFGSHDFKIVDGLVTCVECEIVIRVEACEKGSNMRKQYSYYANKKQISLHCPTASKWRSMLYPFLHNCKINQIEDIINS